MLVLRRIAVQLRKERVGLMMPWCRSTTHTLTTVHSHTMVYRDTLPELDTMLAGLQSIPLPPPPAWTAPCRASPCTPPTSRATPAWPSGVLR